MESERSTHRPGAGDGKMKRGKKKEARNNEGKEEIGRRGERKGERGIGKNVDVAKIERARKSVQRES